MFTVLGAILGAMGQRIRRKCGVVHTVPREGQSVKDSNIHSDILMNMSVETVLKTL